MKTHMAQLSSRPCQLSEACDHTMMLPACRGRALKGELVVDAILMTGIHSILQDDQGDAVKVRGAAGHCLAWCCCWCSSVRVQ